MNKYILLIFTLFVSIVSFSQSTEENSQKRNKYSYVSLSLNFGTTNHTLRTPLPKGKASLFNLDGNSISCELNFLYKLRSKNFGIRFCASRAVNQFENKKNIELIEEQYGFTNNDGYETDVFGWVTRCGVFVGPNYTYSYKRFTGDLFIMPGLIFSRYVKGTPEARYKASTGQITESVERGIKFDNYPRMKLGFMLGTSIRYQITSRISPILFVKYFVMTNDKVSGTVSDTYQNHGYYNYSIENFNVKLNSSSLMAGLGLAVNF